MSQASKNATDPGQDFLPSHTAAEIKAILDERVVGQGSAKTSLSHLLAMHLAWFRNPDILHPTPNALLIGPTGVGKTHSIETAADKIRVPLVIADAARLMPTMGAGEIRFDDIFAELVTSAERLISRTEAMTRTTPAELARRGVVFLDEFDKLNIDPRLPLQSNYVLQRALLQILEGARVPVKSSARPASSPDEYLDTRGILFVASGAFEGIRDERIRSLRPQEIARQGLPVGAVIPADIHSYGFIPELIARLPVFIHFDALEVQDLIDILNNEIVDPSIVYRRYLNDLNVDLKLTDEFKTYIAEQASMLNMGARGLHQILFPILAALSERATNDPPNVLELDARAARRLLNEGR